MRYIQILNNAAVNETDYEEYAKEHFEHYVACDIAGFELGNPKWIYDADSDSIIENPNYEQMLIDAEKERVGKLKLTKRVFALALRQFGITYAQLKEAIAQNEQAQLEWDLCVELERKNPLLDDMAVQFDVTPKQLDYIFRKANGEEIDEN